MPTIIFNLSVLASCLLLLTNLLRYQITSPYSYSFSLAGGCCLYISINLWKYELSHPTINTNLINFLIKACYYSGQYIIMHGALHHSNLLYQIDNFIKNK